MNHRSRRALRAIGTAIAAVALTGLAATGASAQSSTDPGVSAKAVKLGYIFSETGSAGSTFKDAGKACKARIDRAERRGGVNGRKIELESIDDQSSGANLTASQDLVQNRNVFVVVNNSSFVFLSYRYTAQHPGCSHGRGRLRRHLLRPEGQRDHALGARATPAPFQRSGATTTSPKVMKQLGAHQERGGRLRRLAVGDRVGEDDGQDYAAPAQASRASTRTPPSTSAAPTSARWSSASRTRAPTRSTSRWSASTDFAILQGLQQNGVKHQGDPCIADRLRPGPARLPIASDHGPEHRALPDLQADGDRRQGDQAVPGRPQEGCPTGGPTTASTPATSRATWRSPARAGGKTPTRKAFVDGFRNLGTWDQAGLACQPVTVGLDSYGSPPARAASTR